MVVMNIRKLERLQMTLAGNISILKLATDKLFSEELNQSLPIEVSEVVCVLEQCCKNMKQCHREIAETIDRVNNQHACEYG